MQSWQSLPSALNALPTLIQIVQTKNRTMYMENNHTASHPPTQRGPSCPLISSLHFVLFVVCCLNSHASLLLESSARPRRQLGLASLPTSRKLAHCLQIFLCLRVSLRSFRLSAAHRASKYVSEVLSIHVFVSPQSKQVGLIEFVSKSGPSLLHFFHPLDAKKGPCKTSLK